MGIEFRGKDKLFSKLRAMPKQLEEAVWDGTFEIVEEITGVAQSNLQSSVKYGSGEGANSVKNEVVIDSRGKVVGRVFSDKQELLFREFGTGSVGEESPKDLPPGVTPVYSQERWFIPVQMVAIDLEAVYGIPRITIKGQDFFMTRGQPARPWLYPSVKQVQETASDVLKEHVQKGLRKL